MPGFSMARLDDIAEIDQARCAFRPIRHHLGITSFGVNAMTAHADGDRLVNEHDEAEEDSGEELYAVISGHATFEVGGESLDAPTGTFIRVDPGVSRTAFARTAGTTVLCIGAAAPGRVYAVNGWELFADLFPLFESGRYEEGADRAAALLVDDPPYAGIYYNTACFESRAGRIDAALTHLTRAIELQPSLAKLAREDEDLAAVREDAAFGSIVGT